MLARNETIFKWALYAGATAEFFLLQGSVLQRITLWGVIPFVFPILVAVLGMYEGPLPASVYALTVGVLCDLLLPASVPAAQPSTGTNRSHRFLNWSSCISCRLSSVSPVST